MNRGTANNAREIIFNESIDNETLYRILSVYPSRTY